MQIDLLVNNVFDTVKNNRIENIMTSMEPSLMHVLLNVIYQLYY